MFDHMARMRGLASLATVVCLMAVVAGCSLGGPGAVTPVRHVGSTQSFVTHASPSKARLTWQLDLTGTHPGGGGPQE